MKLNKTKPKNKGKVHPSPFPLSSTNSNDPSSNLNNLLPQTILTLISILSLQEKQVLSYMITHSLYSSTTLSNKKVTLHCKKQTPHDKKLPSFDCGCFNCYTSYWFKWDSSPHRELIHLAIDAFEEHLSFSEEQKITTSKKGSSSNNNKVKSFEASSSSSHSAPDVFIDQKKETLMEMGWGDGVEERECDDVAVEQERKGLANKVLPNVIGLFNSRLWNLWGPNV